MRLVLSSRIMARTTLDLDATVLRELKRRREREGKTLGQLASELLAGALAEKTPEEGPKPFSWTSKAMGARIDLEDKEAVSTALDRR
jgi:hypothetical protein